MNPAAAQPLPRLEPSPVAASPAMAEVLLAAHDVAPTPTTVLLKGESGVGKGLLAREIHAHSQRAAGPFITVHCASSPDDLEAELFGPASGVPGLVAQAAGGTLFLDEVCELPPTVQARLLRVLQEREARQAGEPGIRVISSSSRDLATLAEVGRFRSDLYYRLDVFPIFVPPLRERHEDLAPLADALAQDAAMALGIAAAPLGEAALAALALHGWPGNVRELRNLVERALVRCRGEEIKPEHLGLATPVGAPARPGEPPATVRLSMLPSELPLDLEQLERLAIEEALRRVRGNRTHAARLLGIGLRTLRNKLRTWREAGQPAMDFGTDPAELAGSNGSPAMPARLDTWARGSHLERA